MGLMDFANPMASLIDIGGSFIQNDWNKRAAQRAMDFSREMSGTAYQRAVADMKAAGINPMLAYMQGGASSPSGVGFPSSFDAGDIGHSARDMMRMRQELKAGAQNIRESESRERLNEAEARIKRFDGDISEALSFSARSILEKFKSFKEGVRLPTFDDLDPGLKNVPKLFERFRSGAERWMQDGKLQFRRRGEGD